MSRFEPGQPTATFSSLQAAQSRTARPGMIRPQQQQQLRLPPQLLQLQQTMTPLQFKQVLIKYQQQLSMRSGGIRPVGPVRPSVGYGQQLSDQKKPVPLLPAVNTYVSRVRSGSSSLLQTLPTRKRKKIIDLPVLESEEEEDQEEDAVSGSGSNVDSDQLSYTDDSDEESRRRRRKFRKMQEQMAVKHNPSPKEVVIPRKRAIRQTKHHDYSKLHAAKKPELSSLPEVLVPIRLELDVDGYKLCDNFTWNMNGNQTPLDILEKLLTPEKFAEYLCIDLDLSTSIHGSQISAAIKSQVSEYKRYLLGSDIAPPLDSRVPIILDLRMGKLRLRDRFEWDLSSTMSPEEFAIILVKDLGISSEFVALIAHNIREQIFKIKQEGELYNPFALEARHRGEEEARGWCPSLEVIAEDDIDLMKSGRDRSRRAQRREMKSTRRRHGSETNKASEEDSVWTCTHCLCSREDAGLIKFGPNGDESLCESCGSYYEIHEELPDHRLNLCKTQFPFSMSLTINTDLGKIKIQVFCEQAPKAATNFLALAASGYYDGCLFHRNIKGFMVQTGDPSGTGKGGESIYGDTFENEIVPSLKHDRRGIVSMANKGPKTNGSQFFITYDRQPHLDGNYTIFGQVIDGYDTLDLIEQVDVNNKSKPIEPIKIINVHIHANPIAG